MKEKEVKHRLSHFIICLKCKISGKVCDIYCLHQYEAGALCEIVETLETAIKIVEQMETEGKEMKEKKADAITITRDDFRDAVTNASLEFIKDEEITNGMRDILSMTALVVGRIIEKYLFKR